MALTPTPPLRVGGWQLVQDENGSEVGRRLYMPDAGGWLMECWVIENGEMRRATTFAPRISDWLAAVGQQVTSALTQSAVPSSLGLILAKTEQIMSGTTTVKDAIDTIAAEVGGLKAKLDEEQALVTTARELMDRAGTLLDSMPAAIDKAIQDAMARQPLTAEQQEALRAALAPLATEGAEISQAVSDLTASNTRLSGSVNPPAPPPPPVDPNNPPVDPNNPPVDPNNPTPTP